jgi:hypothetical protein
MRNHDVKINWWHKDFRKDLELIMRKHISLVVDAMTFQYDISLVIQQRIDMRLMDILSIWLT